MDASASMVMDAALEVAKKEVKERKVRPPLMVSVGARGAAKKRRKVARQTRKRQRA